MFSSGQVALVTSSAAAVTLIDSGGVMMNRVVITNEGTVGGLFSIDNGQTWGRIPPGTATLAGYVEVWEPTSSKILMKRIGGSDLTGVWAYGGWATNQ